MIKLMFYVLHALEDTQDVKEVEDLLKKVNNSKIVKKAVDFLKRDRLEDGSWWGR